MMFLWGVLATMLFGLVFAVLFDEDAREAALTVGWVLLIGAPVMLWLGVVWLLRKLPKRVRPRAIRGRRLSTRALQRVALHADYQGWMVSRPSTSVLVLRRKADG